MQQLTIQAISVGELTDIETFMVALYDNILMPRDWIEIQKSLSFDSQDVEQGMNTYCVVISSGATHYGGIRSCVLREGSLILRLSAAASEELGIDEEIKCDLQVDYFALASLRSGLSRIFADDTQCPIELVLE